MKSRWVLVALLSFTMFLYAGTEWASSAIGPVIPGWNSHSSLAPAYRVAWLLALIPGGWVADRFGVRIPIAASLGAFALFSVLDSAIHFRGLDLLYLAVLGLSSGFIIGPAYKLVCEQFRREERAAAVAAVLLGGVLWRVAQSTVIQILFDHILFPDPGRLSPAWTCFLAVVGVNAILTLAVILRHVPAEYPVLDVNPSANSSFFERVGREPIVLYIAGLFGLYLAMNAVTWLPPIFAWQSLAQRGFEVFGPSSRNLDLLLLPWVGAMIGLLIGGQLATKWSYRRVQIATAALLAAAFGIGASYWVNSFSKAEYVICGVLFLGHIGLAPLLCAVLDRAPRSSRAMSVSAVVFGATFLSTVGDVAASRLLFRHEDRLVPILVALVTLILVGAGALLWEHHLAGNRVTDLEVVA